MNTRRISISVSEPWELGEALKWRPMRGELLQSVNDEPGGRALVRLEEVIVYRGSVWRYVVASPRHPGKEIAAVQTGDKVLCAFTAVSEQQVEAGDPLETENWRGGLAFIGDFEPTI